MEEWIGRVWDGFIGARAARGFPQAAVSLAGMERTLAVMFRALGGDPAVRIASASRQRTGARRRLVERIAGSGEHAHPPSLNERALRLPPRLDIFPEQSLNRDLYLWLAALAAHLPRTPRPPQDASATTAATFEPWFVFNQVATLQTVQRWPGLHRLYTRLVEAAIALRADPGTLPPDEATLEQAVRQALRTPGSVTALPQQRRGAPAPDPVPLWLYAAPAGTAATRRTESAPPGEQTRRPGKEDDRQDVAHLAERVSAAEARSPFNLPFRAESLLSWADFIRVNRPTEDDDGADSRRIADSVDRLALAEGDSQSAASRVRFDLDLPSPSADDRPLGSGHLLPEWDYQRRILRPDYCRLQPLVARDSVPVALPDALRRPARRLRNQLAALSATRRWQNAEQDGSELDIDACVRAAADRALGVSHTVRGLYRAQTRRDRDLACLLLADLSQSTDAWVSDTQRVIDVIRDSLLLFGEALAATSDPFAMYGFSSLKRSLVRFHDIKHFDEPLNADVRGRIAALRPGYYTRLGAAVREASRRLAQRPAAQRILLLLTDGKPHDIDQYDGRYGIEDTRAAVIEARRAGVRPFCVTIDRQGASYLPHVFGRGGYAVVRRPADLPARLPVLYAQLSG